MVAGRLTPTERVLRALALVGARVSAGHLSATDCDAVVAALSPWLGRDSAQAGASSAVAGVASVGARPVSAEPESAVGTNLALAGITPPPAVVSPNLVVRRARTTRDAVARVFSYWRQATGHARAKLTPERHRAVAARLGQGYTEADIRRAIDGCVASDFHAGRHDDLTLICRNGSKLESFIARCDGTGEPVDDYAALDNAGREQQLRQRIAEAMRDGDHEAYERHNSELHRVLGRA